MKSRVLYMKKFFEKISLFIINSKLKVIIPSVILAIIIGALIVYGVVTYNNKLSKNVKVNQCTIKFDSSGGTILNDIKFNCGSKVEDPGIYPEKEGFTFIGWTYMNQPYMFGNTINEDITIVANYMPLDDSKVIIVSFDSDGGTAVKPIEALRGSLITKPINPTKNGYDFNGWYLNTEEFNFDKAINDNIILKAKWKKSSNPSNNNTGNNSQIKDTPSEYKCSGGYSSKIEENTVTVGYNDQVNWTFSTGISYTPDSCYITYKSSDNSIATVSDKGIINAKSKGDTYISVCINDIETKTEVGCFKGKLVVNASQFDEEKEKAMNFANSVNGYYWYLDGSNYAYLYPAIMKWHDHTLLNWDSKFIAFSGDDLVTSESTGKYYNDDTNIHNRFLANPTELGYDVIKKYNMKVNGSKLYITTGGKTYSFTKNSSKKAEKVSLSLSKNDLNINEGNSENVILNVSPVFINHDILVSSSNSSIATCSGNNTTLNGTISLRCTGFRSGIATITIKDTIGRATTNIRITVNHVVKPVTGVVLSNSNLNLVSGDSSTLVATISPTNADNKKLKWNTSNLSVATVSNGRVTAVGPGKATITVTTDDGNYRASCYIVVSNPPLTVSAGVGLSYACTSNGCGDYTYVYINPKGGSGTYTYSYKVYKDEILIGTYSKKEIYLPYSKGSYKVDYTVTDSEGESVSGTTTTIININ